MSTTFFAVLSDALKVKRANAGVTGAYEGTNQTWRFLIAFFAGLTIYNALELIILIFATFSRYHGVYFYSLLIASTGLIPYAVGFTFKFFSVLEGNAKYASITLLTIGWWSFLTGSNVVLWSRLHLIVTGDRGHRILKYTKWMIIAGAITFHLPTTVLTFGSNGDTNTNEFVRAYSVMERFQMTGFFIQEVILSSVYIVETARILRSSLRPKTSRLLYQLLFINAAIIVMDIGLLGIEYASLYMLETIVKGFTYSVKLKLEFAILSRLVNFVGRPVAPSMGGRRLRSRSPPLVDVEEGPASINQARDPYALDDSSDCVELSRTQSDYRCARSTKSEDVRQSDHEVVATEIWEDGTKH